MQKTTKIVGLSFEGGGGENFFKPQYLFHFWTQEAEIFCALRHFWVPLSFWISRP